MDDSFADSGSEAPPPYLGSGQPPGISERMQALMSRAEQEIAEQRQLQTLVAEVRQSLAQLQDEMHQAAGEHTLEIVRGEVTGLASEVRGSTTAFGERLDAVVRAVGASAQVMQNVGQRLDRLTELVTAQQEQIAALSAAVTRGGEPDPEVREHVGALRQRLDEVAGEVRSDAAATLRSLADRIDSAVIALAEALLRPRGGADSLPPPTAADREATDDDEDDEMPMTATMTVPVVPASAPWTDASEQADDDDEETAPDAPHADEDVEDEPVETTDLAAPDSVAAEIEDAEPGTAADAVEPEEVPLDAWSVDEPPEPAPPSAWGWDAVREHDPESEGESGEKRRPWWRPGG